MYKDHIGQVMFNINNLTGKCIRHIHRNPIRVNICTKIGNYSWSSHRFYLRVYSNFVNVNFLYIAKYKKRAAEPVSALFFI